MLESRLGANMAVYIQSGNNPCEPKSLNFWRGRILIPADFLPQFLAHFNPILATNERPGIPLNSRKGAGKCPRLSRRTVVEPPVYLAGALVSMVMVTGDAFVLELSSVPGRVPNLPSLSL